jgi:hypothetical protein
VKRLNALIACEFSARVRDAFRDLGHNAWSCDLEACEGDPKYHLQGDVRRHLDTGLWDVLIGHPPCTYLSNSGAKHLYIGTRFENGPESGRWEKMRDAAEFFNALLGAPIPRICLENPIQHSHARALIRKYDQVVQPYHFGHAETKATCLWLKGLSPGPERWKNRSRTMPGLALAMAAQWSNL